MVTRTEEALLAAVIANPADDLSRLAYADWLEEHGGDARAEFIRVQVRLARPARCEWEAEDGATCPQHNARRPPGRVLVWCPTCGRLDALRRREQELLRDAAHWWAWLADLYAVTGRSDIGEMGRCSDGPDAFAVGFRRGFVAEVSLPCAAWLLHGPAIVRAAPLERVTLADRTPNSVDGEHRRCYWWHRDLPADIYRLMACNDARLVTRLERPDWKRYPDLAAARAALSGAALAWARAAAVAAPPAAGV